MIEIITAAGFALAWFAFRYDRWHRWVDELGAAQGTLRALHHGMVEGLTPGQATGWAQYYFATVYDEDAAKERARETYDKTMLRMLDYILVVPTEPLARLATAVPRKGLIESPTVAIANFALWRIHAFNQLVRSLGEFLTANAAEITSDETQNDRREELAAAAMSLSLVVHHDGIGQAWRAFPDGSAGWYRALVEAVATNLSDLEAMQGATRWRWLREWPYTVIDVVVLSGFLAVTIAVAL